MYWTLIKYGIPFIIGCLIAGGACWKIQEVRIDKVKTVLEQSQNQVKICQDVNKTNQNTIGILKEDVIKTQKSCDSRILIKEKTIKNLSKIDALKPAPINTNVGGNNETNKPVVSGDDILDALDSMYINTNPNR